MTPITLPNGLVLDQALFDRIKVRSLATVKDAAPNPATRYKRSSGNLAFNAIRLTQVDLVGGSFTIIVNTKIAPYQSFVDNKRTWKDGSPYEYYRWFDGAVELVAREIAAMVGGKVIKS